MAKEKEPDYLVKLTLRNTWIGIGMALGCITAIFTAGIKVQYQISRVEIANIANKYQTDLKTINLTIGSELTSTKLDLEFYKNQYKLANSRLKTCLEKGEYLEGLKE